MYLEVIFAGEDIKSKLPNETKRFFEVDRAWRKLMNHLHDNPILWLLDAEKIKNDFENHNRTLNNI
jgi:hypothetical protein